VPRGIQIKFMAFIDSDLMSRRGAGAVHRSSLPYTRRVMIIPKYEMRMETERNDASHHSNCMQCIASPQKPVMEAPDRAATSQIRPRVCQIMRDKLIGRFIFI
jgi:hypothetical protein